MAQAKNKTQPSQKSVTEFINSLPNAAQIPDTKVLAKIMQEVSGEKPVMWGKDQIGFGSLHYRSPAGREGDWFRIGFAPRKTNFSLYLMGIMYEFDKHKALLTKLGKHKHGKGCLYINKLVDVDLKVLRELIELVYKSKISIEA